MGMADAFLSAELGRQERGHRTSGGRAEASFATRAAAKQFSRQRQPTFHRNHTPAPIPDTRPARYSTSAWSVLFAWAEDFGYPSEVELALLFLAVRHDQKLKPLRDRARLGLQALRTVEITRANVADLQRYRDSRRPQKTRNLPNRDLDSNACVYT
jgi:hypothetical protein